MTPPLPGQVNELTRRISRKLQIKKGMHLSYHDLALLVASGAFGALQQATETELNKQCLSHLSQPSA